MFKSKFTLSKFPYQRVLSHIYVSKTKFTGMVMREEFLWDQYKLSTKRYRYLKLRNPYPQFNNQNDKTKLSTCLIRNHFTENFWNDGHGTYVKDENHCNGFFYHYCHWTEIYFWKIEFFRNEKNCRNRKLLLDRDVETCPSLELFTENSKYFYGTEISFRTFFFSKIRARHLVKYFGKNPHIKGKITGELITNGEEVAHTCEAIETLSGKGVFSDITYNVYAYANGWFTQYIWDLYLGKMKIKLFMLMKHMKL